MTDKLGLELSQFDEDNDREIDDDHIVIHVNVIFSVLDLFGILRRVSMLVGRRESFH